MAFDINSVLPDPRPRDPPETAWHCDYCGADYDEKPEACGCVNRVLRPPGDEAHSG